MERLDEMENLQRAAQAARYNYRNDMLCRAYQTGVEQLTNSDTIHGVVAMVMGAPERRFLYGARRKRHLRRCASNCALLITLTSVKLSIRESDLPATV